MSPTAIPDEMQYLVVAARKAHQCWGPRKVREVILRSQPEVEGQKAYWIGMMQSLW